MQATMYREPEDYSPPQNAEEFLDRYDRGERYFAEARLHGAVLERHTFENINLSRADLSEANARHASFVGVDFSEADCHGIWLDHAGLFRCSFARADMRNACLYMPRIAYVSFFDTRMDNALYTPTIVARENDQSMLDRGLMTARPGAASCFVSYSSRDAVVSEIANALDRASIANWFMPHSSHFETYVSNNLGRAVEACDAFAVVLSVNSIASRWVEHEVECALRLTQDTDKPWLIVLRIDDVAVPDRRPWNQLAGAHTVECADATACGQALAKWLTKPPAPLLR